MTGCAQIHQQVGNAWAVTYEVSVDFRRRQHPAMSLLFVGSESRGDAPEKRTPVDRVDQAPVPATVTTARPGTHELIASPKDPASVMATPEDGRTATCPHPARRQAAWIAEEQGQPGQPVHCKVTTPKFD